MNKKHGFTLLELIIIIAIIIALTAITLPAIKALQNSFTGECSTAVINSLLNSARTIALTRQRYTGVRFQKQKGVQFATFIIHDPNIPYPDDKTIPFTALEGHPPYNLGKADINETTIVFSPQGKLTRKWARVFSTGIEDSTFGQCGLFPQDTVSSLSDINFVILKPDGLEVLYINRYTGTLIDLNK